MRLAERVLERDRELRRLREELAEMRERDLDSVASLAALADELQAMRRQARAQATRMRLRALRDAVEVSNRLGEIVRRPGRASDRLVDSLMKAIERIGDSADEPAEGELAESVAGNGHAERSPGELFDGCIEVEVGPLSDFSQLVGFEDAANGIAATSEISVKRFRGGRATLEMKLKEPVELLRELEERAPFEFVVRDQRADRLILDVDES